MDKFYGLPLRIKQAREFQGISKTELANALNINKSNITRYENGEISNLDTTRLQALANALNVNPSWLIGWSDNKFIEADNKTKTIIPVVGIIAAGAGCERLNCRA